MSNMEKDGNMRINKDQSNNSWKWNDLHLPKKKYKNNLANDVENMLSTCLNKDGNNKSWDKEHAENVIKVGTKKLKLRTRTLTWT